MFSRELYERIGSSNLEILLQYGPLGCFATLLLTAFGLPIPEEVSLIVLGALTYKGSNIVLCWVISFLGVTGGDTIAWYMGKRMGLEPTGFVRRLLGKKSIEDIASFFEEYGIWAIVISRQIPGMRFPTFFFSGASGIPFWKFFLIDGASSMITVNLYFSLGFYFGDRLPMIIEFIENNVATVSKFGLFTVCTFIFWIVRGRRMLRPEG